MPLSNHFRHQDYNADRPTAPCLLRAPAPMPPVGSSEFNLRMQHVGQTYRDAGVALIMLVHGTFVGSDAFGVLAELSRVWRTAGAQLQRASKRLVDRIAGDEGNFTSDYARLFEAAINSPGQPHIPVRLFPWSGQNNHIGRADAAVRLIDQLANTPLGDRQRVLLWGHSHAGNVFALMTNLFSADQRVRDAFFKTARVYYRWPLIGYVDVPWWRQVRRRLDERPGPPGTIPMARSLGRPTSAAPSTTTATSSTRQTHQGVVLQPPLDMVTFGTPIRYGWDTAGYARLLHFIFHRPAAELPDYQVPFPPDPAGLLNAANGDYVQQFGIAGTNLMPSPLAWRSWLADLRLHRFLQPGLQDADLLDRLANGARVPDEGTTLLVDYGPGETDLVGHAVYTRARWLLWHAEQVARRFYGPANHGISEPSPP